MIDNCPHRYFDEKPGIGTFINTLLSSCFFIYNVYQNYQELWMVNGDIVVEITKMTFYGEKELMGW